MFKNTIAAVAATLSMAGAMEENILNGLSVETKALAEQIEHVADNTLEEPKVFNLISREYLGTWWDVVNQKLGGKLEELSPNIEKLEIHVDANNLIKVDSETFDKIKPELEEHLHELKEYHQNPDDFKKIPKFRPFWDSIPEGVDAVAYCDEILARGVTADDFKFHPVTVHYEVRGEGAQRTLLVHLLEHYANNEWMEIAMFNNLPLIEEIDLTNYLNKHGFELDAKLGRLLHLKCPNLKRISHSYYK